ncbi:hypothetical protein [Streptobacillus moniliformis]|uniref:hypothetical protein n=1 Tax=Streptobacillus moniliformis TaxID=34105 RepID=UPI0007E3910F|nr:hypothetical protein [Streptobacillus moniliformis]
MSKIKRNLTILSLLIIPTLGFSQESKENYEEINKTSSIMLISNESPAVNNEDMVEVGEIGKSIGGIIGAAVGGVIGASTANPAVAGAAGYAAGAIGEKVGDKVEEKIKEVIKDYKEKKQDEKESNNKKDYQIIDSPVKSDSDIVTA